MSEQVSGDSTERMMPGPSWHTRALEPLRRTRTSLYEEAFYVVVAMASGAIPMVLFNFIGLKLFPHAPVYRSSLDSTPLAVHLALGAVLSPLVETLGMAGIAALARRVTSRRLPVILLCAAGLAASHAIWSFRWAAQIAWPCIVWSTVYVVSREVSLARAYWRTVAVHALHNTIGIVLIASLR